MTNRSQHGTGGGTVRALALGLLMAGVIAWGTVLRDNSGGEAYTSANLLPAMPYVLLLVLGLLVNPLLRRAKWIRPFSQSELLLILVMCAVSSGLATWGLCARLVPTVSGLSNRAWNNDQSQWDVHVMPHLSEDFFISEEGTRAAAQKLNDAEAAYTAARALHAAAREILSSQEQWERVEAAIAEAATIVDPDDRAKAERQLVWPRRQAESLQELAAETWKEMGEEVDAGEIAETYEPIIESLKAERDRLREELRTMNAPSFDAVDRIREGLPEGDRAVPGFLYSPGEGLASYRARIHRFKVGSRALELLQDADALLAKGIEEGTPVSPRCIETITAAADALTPITDSTEVERTLEKWEAERGELGAQIAKQKARTSELRQARRYAELEMFEAYDEEVEDLQESNAELEAREAELEARIEAQIEPRLRARGRAREAQNALRQIVAEMNSAQPKQLQNLRTQLLRQQAAFRTFDGSPRRFWLGDGDWGIWISPLLHWFLIAFVIYMLFMTFNTLIYRQWAHNEKLIYPIAEVTTLLAGSGDSTWSKAPSLFKSGLFWFGVVLSAGILGWNHLADKGIIANISPIKLQFLWIQYVGGGSSKAWRRPTFASFSR